MYQCVSSRCLLRQVTRGWTGCGTALCLRQRLRLGGGHSLNQPELSDFSKFVPLLANSISLHLNRRKFTIAFLLPHRIIHPFDRVVILIVGVAIEVGVGVGVGAGAGAGAGLQRGAVVAGTKERTAS